MVEKTIMTFEHEDNLYPIGLYGKKFGIILTNGSPRVWRLHTDGTISVFGTDEAAASYILKLHKQLEGGV